MLSALHPAALIALLLGAALIARRQLAETPRWIARTLGCVRARGGWLAVAILSAVALFLTIQALTPPSDWDSLMYHLEVPARFLEQGRVYLPEDNLHASRVGLAHMLYVPLLALGGAPAPALLSAALGLLLAIAAFGFCVRYLAGPTAGWTLVLLWGSTIVLLVAVTARVDVTLGLYLFLAHWAVVEAILSRSKRALYLGAILLGFSLGVKYPALAYAVALSPLIAWAAWRRTATLAPPLRSVAAFGALALAAALPWLLKNALLFGDPYYPLLTHPRLEPWLAELWGSAQAPASFSGDFFRPLREARRGDFSLLDLFFAPGELTIEGEAAQYFANPIFLLLPLWLLVRREKALNLLLLPALGYLGIAVFYQPVPNPRYLIPLLAPLTIVTTHGIVTLATRRLPGRAAWAALLVLAGVALAPSVKAVVDRMSKGNWALHLAGSTSRREYLLRHPEPEVHAYAQIVSFVNEHVPADARILLLLEARGFYFQRDVIQDNRLTNWPLLAARASDGNCLPSTEITHVLVHHGALVYYRLRGFDPEKISWSAFDAFRDRCLQQVYQRAGFTLYGVAPGRR